MSFGEKGFEQQHWSQQNLDFAFRKLQEQPPKYGTDGDTGEKDGKYFAMGYEMQKNEYEFFLNKITELYEEVNTQKAEELDQAA